MRSARWGEARRIAVAPDRDEQVQRGVGEPTQQGGEHAQAPALGDRRAQRFVHVSLPNLPDLKLIDQIPALLGVSSTFDT
jgi:hypothetical protein